ncbi:hypothetical protein EDB85DRAFT_2283598 [Lactarius pseudohatsudake]|nr:hypothetical protein EDB85DRAFT_2283598 [Lactarius pseudohatsudake]
MGANTGNGNDNGKPLLSQTTVATIRVFSNGVLQVARGSESGDMRYGWSNGNWMSRDKDDTRRGDAAWLRGAAPRVALKGGGGGGGCDNNSRKGRARGMTIRIPLEILTAILEEVDDVQDLWHIRTASRTLCAVATPIAFRVLSAIPTRTSAENIGRLFDSPDVAAHVREGGKDAKVWCVLSPPHPTNYTSCSMHPPRWRVTSVNPNIIHELADSFSLVHQLPRLETINLTFCPVSDDSLDPNGGGRLALQASILDALAASFSVRAPPNLTSLSLRNLRILDHLPLESPSFQTFLTPLRRLELSVFINRGLEPETFPASWCHFWSTTFPRMVPAPTHNSLTELALHGGTPVGASAGLSLAALHFPRLCALSLRDLVFEPSVAVEPFVLRHAATLARLEILWCALPTGTDTHLSLSGSEESSPCWERIWDRFAAELTALVELHVDSLMGCLYLWPRPGYDTVPTVNLGAPGAGPFSLLGPEAEYPPPRLRYFCLPRGKLHNDPIISAATIYMGFQLLPVEYCFLHVGASESVPAPSVTAYAETERGFRLICVFTLAICHVT